MENRSTELSSTAKSRKMAIAGSFDRQSLSSLLGVRQSQAMFRACLVACALAFGSPFAQTQVFAEEGDLSVLAIDASFAVAIKEGAPAAVPPPSAVVATLSQWVEGEVWYMSIDMTESTDALLVQYELGSREIRFYDPLELRAWVQCNGAFVGDHFGTETLGGNSAYDLFLRVCAGEAQVDGFELLAVLIDDPVEPGQGHAPPVLSPAQRREIREYFSCVARVLACEAATLACLLEPGVMIPACVAACSGSVVTGGYLCVRCISMSATLLIGTCREAWNCWNAASASGCVPW